MLLAVRSFVSDCINHIVLFKIQHAAADIQKSLTTFIRKRLIPVVGDFGILSVDINGDRIP